MKISITDMAFIPQFISMVMLISQYPYVFVHFGGFVFAFFFSFFKKKNKTLPVFNLEECLQLRRRPGRGDRSQGRGGQRFAAAAPGRAQLCSGRSDARAKRLRAAGRCDLFASTGSQVAGAGGNANGFLRQLMFCFFFFIFQML